MSQLPQSYVRRAGAVMPPVSRNRLYPRRIAGLRPCWSRGLTGVLTRPARLVLRTRKRLCHTQFAKLRPCWSRGLTGELTRPARLGFRTRNRLRHTQFAELRPCWSHGDIRSHLAILWSQSLQPYCQQNIQLVVDLNDQRKRLIFDILPSAENVVQCLKFPRRTVCRPPCPVNRSRPSCIQCT
jgi:hypothetical protein